MKTIFKKIALCIVTLIIIFTVIVVICSQKTENDILTYSKQVKKEGLAHHAPAWDVAAMQSLPEPVQKYFNFTFKEPYQRLSYVEMALEGDFRRPLKTSFAPTTAEQVIAVGEPALIFAATTPIANILWARAYDAYIDGTMDMRAKIVSTLTVVNENSAALNQTSLQRWLLESPLYPMALLPGGPVTWEAIDKNHAKAIVKFKGIHAELIAAFREDGSLQHFQAINDGDLTTPYHGAGEYVLRENYQLTQGMMIPHKFTIARRANQTLYPFWQGQIKNIQYY